MKLTQVVLWLAGLLVLYKVEGVCKTTELTEDEQFVLDVHNKLRQKHQDTPDLCYAESGEDVTFSSQSWADNMAITGEFKHSHGDYGENIAYSSSSSFPDTQKAYNDATNNWYNEVKDWSFDTNEGCPGKVTTHFTQLVWKEAVQLNCAHGTGIIDDKKKSYVVCQYFEKGNFGGPEDYDVSVGDPVDGYVVAADTCGEENGGGKDNGNDDGKDDGKDGDNGGDDDGDDDDDGGASFNTCSILTLSCALIYMFM